MEAFNPTSFSIGFIEGLFTAGAHLTDEQLTRYFSLCEKIGQTPDNKIQEHYEKRK